jgi:hypothetical protein
MPLCHDNEDIFFGPDEDGRKETGRTAREELAKAICRDCVFRLRCLERSLVHSEMYGVWGGMGEGERREFAAHLKAEGYVREIPSGREMYASVFSFYNKSKRRQRSA